MAYTTSIDQHEASMHVGPPGICPVYPCVKALTGRNYFYTHICDLVCNVCHHHMQYTNYRIFARINPRITSAKPEIQHNYLHSYSGAHEYASVIVYIYQLYLCCSCCLLHVFTLSILCCDVCYDFRVKTMLILSLLPLVLSEVYVLFILIVFIYTSWFHLHRDFF